MRRNMVIWVSYPYYFLMKTTLDIDDQLLIAAKQRALDTGSTLRRVVESALEHWLKPRRTATAPIRTVVFTPSRSKAAPIPSSPRLADLAYDMNSPAYWQKRFGYVPPGVK